MSEFKVEVIRIGEVKPLANSDKLQITMVHGGYPCISQLGAFKPGDLAVYVPIDALVPPSNEHFEFLVPKPVRTQDMNDLEWAERQRRYKEELQKPVRIKARRLRGTFSMGLLIPAPPGTVEGQDVQELLKIEKYEPDEANKPQRSSGFAGHHSPAEPGPPGAPLYTDIEGFRKWSKVFVDHEEVVITEKIHGQNARFVFDGKRLYAGSRNQWRKAPHAVTDYDIECYERELRNWKVKNFFFRIIRFVAAFVRAVFGINILTPSEAPRPFKPQNVAISNWWDVAIDYKLEQRLCVVPGLVVYGEIYGPCQDLKYGTPDKLQFRAFDAYNSQTGKWLDYDVFLARMRTLDIPVAPELYRGPWYEGLRALAEGSTTVGGDHVREGIVIRPVKERTHARLGRVILKLVGEGYLLRGK